MALSDDDRAEVAALVAEELDASRRRDEVRAEVRAVLARTSPSTRTDLGSRPPLGRVGTMLGFSPHGLLSALVLGSLFCCSAFDVAAHVAAEPYTYPRSSYWLLVLGLLTSLVAVATGVADHWRLDPDGELAERSRHHQVVTYVALALAVVSFVLRRQTDFVDEVPVGIVLLSLASFSLLVVAWAQGARLTGRAGAAGRPDEVVGRHESDESDEDDGAL